MRSTSRRRNAAVVAGGLVLLLSTAACGSDGSSSKPLAIEGGERGAAMYFDPDSETVPAGTYDVTFDNVGAVHHELALVDASGEALAARSIAGKQTATFEVEHPSHGLPRARPRGRGDGRGADRHRRMTTAV